MATETNTSNVAPGSNQGSKTPAMVHAVGSYARHMFEDGASKIELGCQALVVAMYVALKAEVVSRDHLILYVSQAKKSDSQKEQDGKTKETVFREVFGFTFEDKENNGKKAKDSPAQDFMSRVKQASIVALVMQGYLMRDQDARISYNHNGETRYHNEGMIFSLDATTGTVSKISVLGYFLGLKTDAADYNSHVSLIGRGDKVRNFRNLVSKTTEMLFPSGDSGSGAGNGTPPTRIAGTMKDISIALVSKVAAIAPGSASVTQDVKAELRNARDMLDKYLGDGGESTEIEHVTRVTPEDASLTVLIESLRARLADEEKDATITDEEFAALSDLTKLLHTVTSRLSKLRGMAARVNAKDKAKKAA